MRALYHTRPHAVLGETQPGDFLFVEIDPVLRSEAYREVLLNLEGVHTILDCGVGASPKLNDPTGHTSKDPHWAADYLGVALDLKPEVMIVPDILGDASATRRNFLKYYYIIANLPLGRTKLMYVIQGQTQAQARRELEWALSTNPIAWIGFPRVVHYYEIDSSNEKASFTAEQRITFVESVVELIRESGKQIHLLGMNSKLELEWASKHRISCDTRMASMAAIHDLDVFADRPSGLNIDLTDAFTPDHRVLIIDNINKMDAVYYK